MKEWESLGDILDYAIGQEEAAAAFYEGLATRLARPQVRELLLGFAQEEMGHKTKLLEVKQGRSTLSGNERVGDLRVGDYLVEIAPDPTLDYQQALIVAMKREKAAFKLYTRLASVVETQEVRDLFLALAAEEAKHKLRFELEYDDSILTGN
jgi:rubrerythrin